MKGNVFIMEDEDEVVVVIVVVVVVVVVVVAFFLSIAKLGSSCSRFSLLLLF